MDDEQVIEGSTALQRNQVFHSPRLKAFPTQAQEIYKYLVQVEARGKDEFIVPALFVYYFNGVETKMAHFDRDVTRKQSVANEDFKAFKNRDFRNGTVDVDSDPVAERKGDIVKYNVPGHPGKVVTVGEKTSNNSLYYFITPRRLRRLVVNNNTANGQFLNDFQPIFIELLRQELSVNKAKTVEYIAFEQTDREFVPRVTFLENDSHHDAVRDLVAERVAGVVEARNAAGIADIESNSTVYEVKPCSQWLHGLGQVLGYANATKKRPCLVTFGKCEPQRRKIMRSTCKKYGVSVMHIICAK